MTQLTNDALLEQLGELDLFPQGDEIQLFAGSPTSQTGAYPLKGVVHHITVNNVANASLAMKSILTNEAPSFVFVVNDGAQTVNVFPYKQPAANSQESMNGVANASQAITAGQACMFMSTPPQLKRKGGTVVAGTLDWRAAVLS
jgi:hypothetical protein